MTDPFSGGFDPRIFENVPLFRELAKVMSWTGGPVNWDLASQTAMAIAAPSGDEPGDERAAEEFVRAVDTAELWLDQVTDLPAVRGPVRHLSRAGWVRDSCAAQGLGVYVEPVAEGMTAALGSQLGGAGVPDQLMEGPMAQAMGAMGAMLYGVQIGTVAGHLAGQLLGTYDLGLPTLDPRTVGTVADHAQTFAADYGFEQAELLHWLALREAAHRRQFAGLDWLRERVAELIAEFAAAAEFDPQALLEQLGGAALDPNELLGDPDALREALEGPDAFRVEPTSAQRAVLAKLQALVAFTGGWVDTVVAAAAGDKLPSLARIDEAMLRRRAEQGPGERFLEQLIGLDLKPADIRQGRRFCDAVIAARGQTGLDRAWHSRQHLPEPHELAEPSHWLVRMAAVELEGPSA